MGYLQLISVATIPPPGKYADTKDYELIEAIGFLDQSQRIG